MRSILASMSGARRERRARQVEALQHRLGDDVNAEQKIGGCLRKIQRCRIKRWREEKIMLSRNILVATLIILAGCTSDPRNLRLSAINLDDMSEVQDIRSRLDEREGIALANYIVKHRSTSSRFCGQRIVGLNGKPPSTVGEAIDYTLANDAEERRAIAIALQLRPFLDRQRQLDQLANRRDLLLDMQSMLRAEHGKGADRLPRWQALQSNLTDVDNHISQLESDAGA